MDKIKKLNLDSDQFQIDHLRPIPALVKANTLYWNEIGMLNNLQWNYTLQINSDKLSQVKEIIQKACCTQVSDQEYKLIQDFLENDEYLLKNCGFTTQKLPDLIENNANLVLFFLMKNVKSSDFQDYLDVFINIDVTPATIELIAMINHSMKIPPDFVTYYVYYCIQYCNNIKEKPTQTKIVKYVSIFIRHFLKTKAIVTKDLLTEVSCLQVQKLQAFCIEFTRVNEVSQLFKSVKAFNELGA
ncbi:unnamed protein product (macronuclear) [Paramecium tetraurelia]|uniref:CCR4-NOT transcription complex subunit 11 n=1 Tax=Paramecium tetraurelia TaxID=5888 RepID=A0CE96_PARTE|nr:uncharacterized protein GSPATT00037549001 [Paramecium tetraurelia]CAK69113.1 unnamed protein product [Paramecium tetraurelia]|eukprot:XP_001436510.1 hypothetical protein (macronuclear) [Paramecium tetraurelia strain d4-2]